MLNEKLSKKFGSFSQVRAISISKNDTFIPIPTSDTYTRNTFSGAKCLTL